MSVKPDVAIVGYGRVGKVLLKALPFAGWQVSTLITKQDGMQGLKCNVRSSISELPMEAGLVILCLRDKDIYNTIQLIPGSRTQGILCHTAGALSAEILAPAREKGWRIMAWHPMQTLTGDEEADIFKNVTFGIDGDEEAMAVGEQLARDLGGVPYRVIPEFRREYHLGAVIASNLLVGLVGEAVEVLQRAGMDEVKAIEAITPLMQATIRNLSRKGLNDSVTGPILRGDTNAIEKHLSILKGLPHSEQMYRSLSLSLLEILEETEERTMLKKILELNK